jgi:hypothetical protein
MHILGLQVKHGDGVIITMLKHSKKHYIACSFGESFEHNKYTLTVGRHIRVEGS